MFSLGCKSCTAVKSQQLKELVAFSVNAAQLKLKQTSDTCALSASHEGAYVKGGTSGRLGKGRGEGLDKARMSN